MTINRIKMLNWVTFSAIISSHCFAAQMSDDHKQWLTDKFSAQHQRLMPVVAVADMLFGCYRARQANADNMTIPEMIVSLDRQVLAEKLTDCLNGLSVSSDRALNYGLVGCFHEQLKELTPDERQAKEKLVNKAIIALSKEERQKSFTQCVTDQSIGYLR